MTGLLWKQPMYEMVLTPGRFSVRDDAQISNLLLNDLRFFTLESSGLAWYCDQTSMRARARELFREPLKLHCCAAGSRHSSRAPSLHRRKQKIDLGAKVQYLEGPDTKIAIFLKYLLTVQVIEGFSSILSGHLFQYGLSARMCIEEVSHIVNL